MYVNHNWLQTDLTDFQTNQLQKTDWLQDYKKDYRKRLQRRLQKETTKLTTE